MTPGEWNTCLHRPLSTCSMKLSCFLPLTPTNLLLWGSLTHYSRKGIGMMRATVGKEELPKSSPSPSTYPPPSTPLAEVEIAFTCTGCLRFLRNKLGPYWPVLNPDQIFSITALSLHAGRNNKETGFVHMPHHWGQWKHNNPYKTL